MSASVSLKATRAFAADTEERLHNGEPVQIAVHRHPVVEPISVALLGQGVDRDLVTIRGLDGKLHAGGAQLNRLRGGSPKTSLGRLTTPEPGWLARYLGDGPDPGVSFGPRSAVGPMVVMVANELSEFVAQIL